MARKMSVILTNKASAAIFYSISLDLALKNYLSAMAGICPRDRDSPGEGAHKGLSRKCLGLLALVEEVPWIAVSQEALLGVVGWGPLAPDRGYIDSCPWLR